MNKQAFIATSVAAGMVSTCAISVYFGSIAPGATAAQTVSSIPKKPITQAVSSSSALFPAPGAHAVVDAANAFLATLTEKQRATVLVERTAENDARWSNFPAAVVPRNGIYFRDLTAKQAEAALNVARVALSREGYERFQGVRAADDAFANSDEARRGPGGGGPGGGGPRQNGGGPGGPPPGGFSGQNGQGGQGGPPRGGFGGPGGFGGGNLFGNGNYIIAFLGTPSKTAPWLLQLGGHHFAVNTYYNGTTGTATPYFVGVQPNTFKDAKGQTQAPLAPLRNAMYDLVHSLTAEQAKQAKLSTNYSDVLVGPGKDGQFPTTQEGVSVSALSAASKAQVKDAIAAWTGDSVQAPVYRKRYYAELDQTTISYSGTTGVNQSGDYVRIAGPHVWIEFACQGSDHYHTIWRDKTTDYGAEFSF